MKNFDKTVDEMLVIMGKKKYDDKSEEKIPEPVKIDGFTDAINGMLDGIGAPPLPTPVAIEPTSDTPAPISSVEGQVDVGSDEAAFEKTTDGGLKIVFKNADITLSSKAVEALRDFLSDSVSDDDDESEDDEDKDSDEDDDKKED